MDLLRIAARVAECAEQERSGDSTEHTSIVRKTKDKSEWCVKSEKPGSDWSGGCYPSKAKADARLKEVEMHKHMKGNKGKKRKGSTLDYLMSNCEYVTRRDVPMTEETLRELWASVRAASRSLRAYGAARRAGLRTGMMSWVVEAPKGAVLDAARALDYKVGDEEKRSGLTPILWEGSALSVLEQEDEDAGVTESHLFTPGTGDEAVEEMVAAIERRLKVPVEENSPLFEMPEPATKGLPRTEEGTVDESRIPDKDKN